MDYPVTQGSGTNFRKLSAVAIAALLLGCSTAASVFLDTPQQPQQAQSPETASPSAPLFPNAAAEDSARPHIETIKDPDSVLALLPRDQAGQVDWVQATKARVIEPRGSLPGQTAQERNSEFGYDFMLKGPNEFFDALFPHSTHVEEISCKSCHPTIFPYRDAPITMQQINGGESCGQCHGTVAFSASTCVRCHTAMPAPTAKPASFHDDVILGQQSADSGATVETPGYQVVRFPHWVHRIRYKCSACHPNLFEMRGGSSSLTMAAIQEGEACGVCHDGNAAFGLLQCDRCHVSRASTGDPLQ